MTQIFYWKGAQGKNDLLTEHYETIIRILNQDYAAADLEKLRHNDQSTIYSFRLNQADRLLFTTRILNGKPYLHVLEFIKNHDYQKSRFLKNHVLRNYFNNQNQDKGSNKADAIIEFSPLTLADEKPQYTESTPSEAFNPIPLDYFNRQFIQLHTEQQEVMSRPLPFIINGVGGSGKTYLALSSLSQFIDTHDSNYPAKILYITKEASLIEIITQHWAELDITLPNNIQIEFLTYNQLLSQFVTFQVHSDEQHNYLNWLNNQKKSSIEFDNQFHEFKICSVHTREQYLELGEHQSTCPREYRIHMYDQYCAFESYLISNHLIDPVFHTLKVQPTYARIVVDEAQNLALKQLVNIHQLAIHDAILYCMDPQQNLVDQSPVRRLLQQLHWSREHNLKSIHLNRTYRCPVNITNTVNTLLQAKRHILGKIDKDEIETLLIDNNNPDPGHVVFASKNNINQHQDILQRHTTPHFAVITQEHLIDEARNRFNTALVFTVERIQGLEYHTIVIYQLLADNNSQQHLKAIHKPLKTIETERRTKEAKQECHYLAPWFNKLYTAFTRAQHTLLICEDVKTHQDGLIQLLQNSVQRVTFVAKQPIPIANTSRTDWEKEALRQEARGNLDIVKDIKARYLKVEPIKPTIPDAAPVDQPTAPTTKKKKNNAKKKTKKTPLTEIENRTLDILNRFNEKGTIRAWTEQTDFMTTLFDTPISISHQAPKSLFYHIIESEIHSQRFAIALGVLPTIGLLHNNFIPRMINEAPQLPTSIVDKILYHLFIYTYSLLSQFSIRSWVFKMLDQQRFERLYVNACQTDMGSMLFVDNIINNQILNTEIRSYFINILTKPHPITKNTSHNLLIHTNVNKRLDELLNPNLERSTLTDSQEDSTSDRREELNLDLQSKQWIDNHKDSIVTNNIVNLNQIPYLVGALSIKQRRYIFEFFKDKIIHQISTIDILIRIKWTFSLSSAQFLNVLTEIKHSLPNLILSTESLLDINPYLCDEHFEFILNAISEHLPRLISTPDILIELMDKLDKKQKDINILDKNNITRKQMILSIFHEHDRHLIEDAQNLSVILSKLTPEKGREFMSSLNHKLQTLVNNSATLSRLLCYLDPDQCRSAFAVFMNENVVYSFINSAQDIFNIFRYIDDKSKNDILILIQPRLPDLIHNHDDLIYLLCYTNDDQFQIILTSIQNRLFDIIDESGKLLAILASLNSTHCKALLSAIEHQLPELIQYSPQAVYSVFYYLDESQRVNVFNQIKKHLPTLIDTLDDFIQITYYLNENERKVVYPIIKNKLSTWIDSAQTASRLLQHQKGIGRLFILLIVKRRLTDLVNSPDDVCYLIKHLNSTECERIFALIKQIRPDLINRPIHVGYTFRHLNDAQYKIVLSIIKPDLIHIIKNCDDLIQVLRYLDQIPCQDFLATMGDHVHELVKNINDLIHIIQYLNDGQREALLKSIHPDQWDKWLEENHDCFCILQEIILRDCDRLNPTFRSILSMRQVDDSNTTPQLKMDL